MSVSNCLRAAILTASLMALNGATPARAQVTCERETISMAVSPDNTWVALVQEGVCSNGALVTVSTDTVRLAARRDAAEAIQLAPRVEKPEYDNDILVVDYYGHPESRPLVQWLSREKLQITIPNISGVGLQKSSYQGVNIVVKYEPDDPVAREKWQKEHGPAPK